MVVVPAISERFIFFLIGLIDLDDSDILILFEYFSKDSYMSKNIAKIKPVLSSCFLYVKIKMIKKLLRSILHLLHLFT